MTCAIIFSLLFVALSGLEAYMLRFPLKGVRGKNERGKFDGSRDLYYVLPSGTGINVLVVSVPWVFSLVIAATLWTNYLTK